MACAPDCIPREASSKYTSPRLPVRSPTPPRMATANTSAVHGAGRSPISASVGTPPIAAALAAVPYRSGSNSAAAEVAASATEAAASATEVAE